MSEIGAPAASPAPAPSAPASAPAAQPAADTRGAPPRGHKWSPQGPQAPAKSPQAVATGTEPPQRQKAPQGAPAKPQPATREPVLVKHRLADGSEIDLDVSEHLEKQIASYKRKVKVNGQEREYSLAEAFERLPLAEGAHERFRAAAETEKQAKAREEQLRTRLEPLRDPKQALRVLTQLHGPEQAQRMMEEFLAAQYQRENMPPEQRRALEEREQAERGIETEREKLQRERQEFEAQKAEALKVQREQATKVELTRIQRDFPILLKTAGFWPSESADGSNRGEVEQLRAEAMSMLAGEALEAKRLKIPLTEAQLAERVAKRMQAYVRTAAQTMDPETLRGLLGKQADRIREADVARVMNQPGRGRPVMAKPGKIPESIKTPEQLKKHLRQQDLAAEARRR